MDSLPKNGLGTLAQTELELERILELIPVEFRGLRFERVMKNFHPQEVTSMLELGFALEWTLRNRGANNHIFYTILSADEDDPRKDSVPRSAREWEVAELVAATIMRWLPTAVGCGFLQAAFERGGGSMNYMLPDPEKGMPPLPPLSYVPVEAANESRPNFDDDLDQDEDDDWPMT